MFEFIAKYTRVCECGYTDKRIFAKKGDYLYELQIGVDETGVEAFRYLRKHSILSESYMYRLIVIITKDY